MLPSADGRNALLAALAPADADLLRPDLEQAQLPARHVMERPNVPIEHVYFPDSGIGSVIARGGHGRLIEAALFGRDGMSGIAVVMGDDRSPNETVMQVGGEGRRIPSDGLRRAMDASGTLRPFLLRYALAMQVQTAQTALANGRARLEERLSRWLLMCHDRVDGEELPVTHDFLAIMLGVRRPGVTVAVHALESRGLIHAGRGAIVVADRAGLEVAADGSYGVPEAEYRRLIG